MTGERIRLPKRLPGWENVSLNPLIFSHQKHSFHMRGMLPFSKTSSYPIFPLILLGEVVAVDTLSCINDTSRWLNWDQATVFKKKNVKNITPEVTNLLWILSPLLPS